MKKTLIMTILAFIMFAMSSCEDKATMAGTWKISAMMVDGIDFLQSPFLEGMEGFECYKEMNIVFDDKTFTIKACEEQLEYGTYTLENGICTMISENQTMNGTVSDNTLTISIEEDLEGNKVEMQMIFTKQK